MKKVQFLVCVIVGLVLMALALAVMPTQPLVPAEAGFPTPQCCAYGVDDKIYFDYLNTTILTTTETCGGGIQTAPYALADIQQVWDITGTQDITCNIEYSNDNVNWCDGPNVAAGVTTDTIACEEYNLFGRFTRICCTAVEAAVTTSVKFRAKAFD